MKFLVPVWLSLLCLAGLSACLPVATPLPPTPTSTPLPPTLTPTVTPVWFPPTPTNTPLPTQVISPTFEVKPPTGDLVFQDDFSAPGMWSLGRIPAGSVALGKNELTLAVSRPGGYLTSLRSEAPPHSFYAEITASPSLCRGADEYGILLRVSATDDFFRFAINCNGQARIDRFLNGKASSPQPLMYSGAIPPGAPSTSVLAVASDEANMDFFVNSEYLFSVRDPVLLAGDFGVFARSEGDTAVTVNFSALKVYRISVSP